MTPSADMRRLGEMGPVVSRFGLGALAFADETDAATASQIMDRYVGQGGNHLDVADAYGQGRAETIVGDWLRHRGNRDELVIAGKVGQAVGPGHHQRGLHPSRLPRAVHASLDRLGTDYLDLLYLHCWDPTTPLEDTLAAAEHLVERGTVRALGVSNHLPSQLQRTVLLQQFARRVPVVAYQGQYSLIVRDIETEILPLCADEQVGLVVWSPLCGGWLAGAFSRAAPPVDHPRDRSIFAYRDRATPRTWSIVDAVAEVARRHDATSAQVALAWLLHQSSVACVLLGPSSPQQLDENLSAIGLVLDEGDLAALDEVSGAIEPEYPHAFARLLARQFES